MAGVLTLDEIKGEIRSAIANRTDLDARLLRIINLSQERIARVHRWEELEQLLQRTTDITTDADIDRLVPIPKNTRDIYSLLLIDTQNKERSRKLTRRHFRSIDRNVPAPDYYTRRIPTSYVLWRETLELFPVPDKVYTLRARAILWPTAFTGDAQQVSDLDHKDDMIISLSISWCFQTLKMKEEAQQWWAIYKGAINDAAGEEVEVPDMDHLPNAGLQNSSSSVEYYKDPFSRSVDGDLV